jgi:hypothetical protein
MPDLIRHPVATQAIGKQGVFASVVTGCRIKSGMTALGAWSLRRNDGMG